MYVIDGSFNDNDKHVTRTLWGNSYDEVIAQFKRMHPGVTCINVDHLSKFTAKTYGMTYVAIEQCRVDWIR